MKEWTIVKNVMNMKLDGILVKKIRYSFDDQDVLS